MSGKNGSINPATNDYQNTKVNMMDMWRESIHRAQQKRLATNGVAKEQNTAKSDLEQRIRNGQEECPTCAARTYADVSGDKSVSFQAPKHIPTHSAASTVMNHEREHVTGEAAKARDKGGEVVSSTVSLEYGICPDCGRKYVSGGVTKTVVSKPVGDQNKKVLENASKRFRTLDASV